MEANACFKNETNDFWGYVRFIGDHKGYSKKGNIILLTEEEIENVLLENEIKVSEDMLIKLEKYFKYRKNAIDGIKNNLMNLDESKNRYEKLYKFFVKKYGKPQIQLPFNKQKGDKKDLAFFTCQINLLTEIAKIEYNKKNNQNVKWNYDPRHLSFFINSDYEITSTLSRRFDGAIPDTINPVGVWEIKEYYYTTTFGSRIADGVYETQLDGFEIKDFNEDVKHVFLCDAYDCWLSGLSYICRLVDALNMGLVDRLYFGKEIYDDWEQYVTALFESTNSNKI